MSKKKAPKTPSKVPKTPLRDRPSEGLLQSPIAVTPVPTKKKKNKPAPKQYKTLYLIRHGESLGQAAPRQVRQTDPNLLDCALTPKGISQALHVPKLLDNDTYDNIELVVSSPLTRALLTSAHAFPDKPILVHYHARELGSHIPENTPRAINHVQRDLQTMHFIEQQTIDNIDFDSLQPDAWPHRHDALPKVIRRDRIRDLLYWLTTRPECKIAMVCHYHVIRAALQDPSLQPSNGAILECRLCIETGELTLAGSE